MFVEEIVVQVQPNIKVSLLNNLIATLKNFPKLISAPVTLSKKSGSKVKFDPKPGANFSRRFSRGDSIPGFIKVEPVC